MQKIRIMLIILPLLGSSFQVFPQSRKQLEAKRKKVEQDIEYTKQILKKTGQKKTAALHNLNAVNEIIVKRIQVIDDLKDEIIEVDSEIEHHSFKYNELQNIYLAQKLKLRKTIVKAFKTRKNANELAFVFASASFRQGLKRLKYLKKLSQYRTYAVNLINAKKDSVKHGLKILELGKKDKKMLLTDEELAKQNLEKDKLEKKIMVGRLAGQEDQLRKKIRENEVAIKRLNNAISSMIAQEIANARKKAQQRIAKVEPARPSNKGSTDNAKKSANSTNAGVSLTPEAREISNSFEANKGSLGWPVERGYISESFGVHQHADLSGITLINNGIDITTTGGSEARAVFKGTVSAIINIPGQEKAILVNHGEYFTVYSRLSQVYVTKGQEIQSRQSIGKIWTDDEKTVLQFQIWKGQIKQNPALWIASR